MVNSYAYEIKERLDTRTVLTAYGMEINRAGFCRCPFHIEKTASMKVYDGNRGWHCFGCGKSGSIIDFVIEYFDLDLFSACEKINNDFNLALPIGRAPTLREQRRAEKAVRERKTAKILYEEKLLKIQQEYYKALDYFIRIDRQRKEYAPEAENSPINDFYIEAVKNIDRAKDALNDAETRLYEYEHKRE